MFFYLLLAFIGIPLIEIILFIQVGGAIGTAATIAIVIGTAFLGAWMLRRQGLSTARTAQEKLARGEMPLEQALDGLFLVFAGGLLLTPGFLTDAIGFSLFVPQVRQFLRGRMVAAARRNGSFQVHSYTTGSARNADPQWDREPGMHRPANDGGKTIEGDAVDLDQSDETRGPDDSPWRTP